MKYQPIIVRCLSLLRTVQGGKI